MRSVRQQIGRREFLRGAALTGGALFGLHAIAKQCPAARATQSPLPVRVNVGTLDASHPILKSYAAAITEMRKITAMDPLNPLGWTFQANMHWTPAREEVQSTAWNQCQHGTRWFFPWHRGYLYFFERIIRGLSGDANFTIPYWKWDDAQTRALPLPFRQDPSSPLFDDTRGINDGTELPGVQLDQDLATATAQMTLDPSTVADIGFSFQFDSSPHGLVHVETGGRMGSVPTAARDAVFFLHHANVDRLWNRWLDDPQHANPTDDAWLKNIQDDGTQQLFTYFDETKKQVQLTSAEVLKMAAEAYKYDDDKEKTVAPPVRAETIIRVPPPMTIASLSKETFELSNKPVEIKLSLGSTGSKRLTRTMAAVAKVQPGRRGPRTFVVIQGLSTKTSEVPVHYYVYLKAKNGKPEEQGEYIGTIHFFGRIEHGRHDAGHDHEAAPLTYDEKFDATKALHKLSQGGKKPLDDVTVTFVPVANGKPKDKSALEKLDVKGISFERIVMQTVD